VQLELVLPLGDHRHHAGVVRARADLAEPDLVALDEQLHAEQALAAQVVGDGLGDLARRSSAAGSWGAAASFPRSRR
jgi:ABC-type taurine transport system ATPase subunit